MSLEDKINKQLHLFDTLMGEYCNGITLEAAASILAEHLSKTMIEAFGELSIEHTAELEQAKNKLARSYFGQTTGLEQAMSKHLALAHGLVMMLTEACKIAENNTPTAVFIGVPDTDQRHELN